MPNERVISCKPHDLSNFDSNSTFICWRKNSTDEYDSRFKFTCEMPFVAETGAPFCLFKYCSTWANSTLISLSIYCIWVLETLKISDHRKTRNCSVQAQTLVSFQVGDTEDLPLLSRAHSKDWRNFKRAHLNAIYYTSTLRWRGRIMIKMPILCVVQKCIEMPFFIFGPVVWSSGDFTSSCNAALLFRKRLKRLN